MIIKLAWYDKKTEFLVDETVITHLFSENELMLLLGEKEQLIDCYPITTAEQRQYIEKRMLVQFSEEYDYFIEISGDYTLDLRDCIWKPAPASKFTDKEPIDRLDAEKAFLSNDPEKIIDALIRVVFFDPDRFYIQEKCIHYLTSDNLDIQREAIIGIGHLVRMHGNIDVKRIVPMLKQLESKPELLEVVEEALDDIESFQNVKREDDQEE